MVAWAPFAYRAALRLNARDRFDCVITSSPPESVHSVGRALRRRGVPWVADLRDAWTFEPIRPGFPTRLQRRLRRAAGTPLARRCRRGRLRQPPRRRGSPRATRTGPRAGPERLGPRPVRRRRGHDAGGSPPRPRPDLARLHGPLRQLWPRPGRADRGDAHTGDGAPGRGGQARARRRRAADRGRGRADGNRRLAGADRGRRHPDRADALALQRAADALLLLASSRRTQLLNFKLFEYLAAARPILALAAGTEAGRIVEEAGGEAVPADDPAAIVEALRRLVAGDVPPPDPEARQRYSYPTVAERMAAVAQGTIARPL